MDGPMDYDSATPSIVKSIKQRDLLNTWLRLYARDRRPPAIAEYDPTRLTEELADLVCYTVDLAQQPPRLTIRSDGTRMSSTYGQTGKGRLLDEDVARASSRDHRPRPASSPARRHRPMTSSNSASAGDGLGRRRLRR
jgi:hypothetical protein